MHNCFLCLLIFCLSRSHTLWLKLSTWNYIWGKWHLIYELISLINQPSAPWKWNNYMCRTTVVGTRILFLNLWWYRVCLPAKELVFPSLIHGGLDLTSKPPALVGFLLSVAFSTFIRGCWVMHKYSSENSDGKFLRGIVIEGKTVKLPRQVEVLSKTDEVHYHPHLHATYPTVARIPLFIYHPYRISKHMPREVA